MRDGSSASVFSRVLGMTWDGYLRTCLALELEMLNGNLSGVDA